MGKIYSNENFQLIKVNSFKMGSGFSNTCFSNEIPSRNITLTKDIYMQIDLVTNEEFDYFLKETNYVMNEIIDSFNGVKWVPNIKMSEILKETRKPVVGVSYKDVQARWVSKKDKVKYRLPTEAEFEFVLRKNCKSIGCCDNVELMKKTNLMRKENEMYKKSAYEVEKGVIICGIRGLIGNVCQWCSDWYTPYDSMNTVDPNVLTMPSVKTLWNNEYIEPVKKVIRGGSFNYEPNTVRCSYRHVSKVDDKNNNLGFRLVFEKEINE